MSEHRDHPVRPVRACRSTIRGTALVLAAVAVLGAGRASAAPPLQPVSPFDMVGFLQAATLGSVSDLLSGGTLTVNGQTVVVPRNLIVQLPATFLAFEELFSLAPAPYGFRGPVPQTGLALLDSPQPLTTFEVHVQGNRVGDKYIAGLVNISQQALNSGQGFINFIDYSTGELRVGGPLGDPTQGQRVRLNDPLGRFGRASSPDPRFTIDEENPSVRTETAYPVCIPRAQPDALCPQENRPLDFVTGDFAKIFTMNPPGNPGIGLDPLRMAPLEVGDFITYAGTLVKDGAQPTAGPAPTVDQTYISAWTVIANLGIFTVPGTDPVYVAIDVAILGVGGAPAPGLPQEATVRTRFEGFTTDPTRQIDLFGIDIDPCTGSESPRQWGSIDIDQGPPLGAVKGRWRFRPPAKVLSLPPAGTFLPPTREVFARARSSALVQSTNGLSTGQYRAPIGEFLFPENLGIGNPPVPLNLQDFPFLAQGMGPWPTGNGIVGQLNPWPGKNAPPAPNCAPPVLLPPVANAGLDQTVLAGTLATLDASASSSPSGFALSYQWTPPAGVTLSSTAAIRPAFIAPISVLVPTPFVFTLQVTDAAGTSAPTSVTVTVIPTPATSSPPTADAGVPLTVPSNAPVQLNGTNSSDPNLPALALTYAWTQVTPAAQTVTLTGADTARPTFQAPLVSPADPPAVLTFQLVVTNSAGLTDLKTVDVTVNPVAAPNAAATFAQLTVPVGASVVLDGTPSNDPNGLPLSYTWTQISGPPVVLPPGAAPSFTAPKLPLNIVSAQFVFTLTVSNGVLSSAPILVIVTVSATQDQVTILSAVYRAAKGRLTVTASSSVPNAVLTLTTPGVPAAQFTLLAGVLTVDLVGVPAPADVTVTSNLGGTATSPLTRIR